MARLFRHGDLRLYLLKLLDDEPRHGYELIQELEDRFLGLYRPSPGTIYPRLAALEEEGLVTHEGEGRRKVYRITERGREELRARDDDWDELADHLASTARSLARDLRDEVRVSVRDLTRELRDAAREARRQEQRSARAARERGAGRLLQDELDAFVADVRTAARRHRLDELALEALRAVLDDARGAVVEVLERRRATEAVDVDARETAPEPDEGGEAPARALDGATSDDSGGADDDPVERHRREVEAEVGRLRREL